MVVETPNPRERRKVMKTLKWFHRPQEVTNTYVVMITEGEFEQISSWPTSE